MLQKAGVSAIYGPGSNIPHAASEILGIVKQRRKAA
jgi:methylmalonyl-CoA mutase